MSAIPVLRKAKFQPSRPAIAAEWAQGMVFCAVGSQAVNLVNNDVATPKGGANLSFGRFSALHTSANGDRWDFPFRTSYNFANGFTVLAVVRSTGGAATNQFVINQNFDGTSVPVSLNVGAVDVTSGCGFFNGGWRTSLITTNITGDNTWHVVGGIANNGTNQQQYYLDGKLDRQSTGSGNNITTNTNAISVGEYVNGANSFIGDIAMVAVWNYPFQTTALTSPAMLALTADLTAPWQIFRAAPQRRFMYAAGATPPSTAQRIMFPTHLSGIGSQGIFFGDRLQ